MIKSKCERCGMAGKHPDEMGGKTVTCSTCGHQFMLPKSKPGTLTGVPWGIIAGGGILVLLLGMFGYALINGMTSEDPKEVQKKKIIAKDKHRQARKKQLEQERLRHEDLEQTDRFRSLELYREADIKRQREMAEEERKRNAEEERLRLADEARMKLREEKERRDAEEEDRRIAEEKNNPDPEPPAPE